MSKPAAGRNVLLVTSGRDPEGEAAIRAAYEAAGATIMPDLTTPSLGFSGRVFRRELASFNRRAARRLRVANEVVFVLPHWEQTDIPSVNRLSLVGNAAVRWAWRRTQQQDNGPLQITGYMRSSDYDNWRFHGYSTFTVVENKVTYDGPDDAQRAVWEHLGATSIDNSAG